jgi:hypothetical protein
METSGIVIEFVRDGNMWSARPYNHPLNLGPEEINGFGVTPADALNHLISNHAYDDGRLIQLSANLDSRTK